MTDALLTPERRDELKSAMVDMVSHMAAMVSGYEEYVGRVDRMGRRDPLYTTRIRDFERAVERARSNLFKFFPELKP